MKIIKKTINDIALAKKKQLVSEICDFEKLIKINNSNNKNAKNLINENKKNNNYSFVSNIIKKLNLTESLIIQNNFINKIKKSNWYSNYWSKTTYYKKYNESLNSFIYWMYQN